MLHASEAHYIACRLPVLIAVALAFSTTMPAQTNTGTISCEIRDASSAVVADANTRLSDAQTGFERRGVSNEAGVHWFPLVPAGIYRLVFEANGFKNVTIPVTLEVGQISGSIAVRGTVQLVNGGTLASNNYSSGLLLLGSELHDNSGDVKPSRRHSHVSDWKRITVNEKEQPYDLR